MLERVLVAGQFFQRHADLIAGVKFKIESEGGLTGSNGTRQILALLAAFEHGQVRIEDVGAVVRTRAVDQNLGANGASTQESDRPATIGGRVERTNRVSAYPFTPRTLPSPVLTGLDCSLLYIQTARLQGKI